MVVGAVEAGAGAARVVAGVGVGVPKGDGEALPLGVAVEVLLSEGVGDGVVHVEDTVVHARPCVRA